MNIRLHLALKRFYNIFRLISPLFACAVLASAWPYIIGALVLAYFIPLLLIWFIPVECLNFGCTGNMKFTSQRTSFWFTNSLYTCDNCGVIFEERSFDPNIEITFEAG